MELLAGDIGASNGRVMLGDVSKECIRLEELYRFGNDPQELNGVLYWDMLRILHELERGINLCAQRGERVEGIGLCTWGNTVALLDKDQDLLANLYHYRDACHQGMLDEFMQYETEASVFGYTGYKFMPIQPTVFLTYIKKNKPRQFECIEKVLLVTDFLNFTLSGIPSWETSICATSQMVDMRTMDWNRQWIARLGLPDRFFGAMIKSGTEIGDMRPEIIQRTGLKNTPKVIAVAGHDTASAAATFEYERLEDSLYLSCGTWSCMGCSTKEPVFGNGIEKSGITNDVGAFGETQLRFNHTGLWIIQQCKRQWDSEGKKYSWPDIVGLAEKSKPFLSVIDTEDELFFSGGNMADKVAAYCKKANQSVPRTDGEIARIVYESLAFRYRFSADALSEISGIAFTRMHMLGGGRKNRILCEFTANSLGKPVVCAAEEAPVLGNIMLQALALGYFDSIEQAREAVSHSYQREELQPQDIAVWEKSYQKARSITGWQ